MLQAALEDIWVNEAELFEQNRAENILFLNQEAEIKRRLAEAEAEVEKQEEVKR